MPKTKEQKSQLLADYKDNLKKVKAIVLTKFSSLKTKKLFELKDQLFEKEIDYKVIKNRIFNIALKEQGIEIPSEILDEPLALAFSYNDEIEPAKIIYNFAKENERLEILGGISNKKFLDAVTIKTLALLPGREDLYARLVRVINTPRYKLIGALKYNQIALVNILSQIKK